MQTPIRCLTDNGLRFNIKSNLKTLSSISETKATVG